MRTDKTCNVTEFADKCGVSIQTISRWVSDGCLKPEITVGNVSYFGEDALAQARLILLRKKKPKSYLVVIVSENEESLKADREIWNKYQQKELPNGNAIKNLSEYMKFVSMSVPPVEKTVIPKITSELAEDMVKVLRSEVKDIALGGADICKDAQNLPEKFFLDMAFGNELNPENLGIYNSLSLKSFYSPREIHSRCQQRFWNIAEDYGFREAIRLNRWSLEQIYYEGEELLVSESSFVNPEAPKAKRKYKPEERKMTGKVKLGFINEIARQGYFTIIEMIGELSDEQRQFIKREVSHRNYRSIYLSSSSCLDDELTEVIGFQVENGMKMIVAKE